MQISATVRNTAVTNSVYLTVAKSALFVRLGTGNTVIVDDNGTTYHHPYSVVVTDSSGNAAVGKVINLSLTPVAFAKGWWWWDGTTWNQVVESPSPYCISEDWANENGILDPTEDVNLNGVLDPGNIASVPGTVTIGSDGTASFDVTYAREFAQWVQVRLTAAAGVAGTEGTDTVYFWLPISVDAVKSTGLVPGYVSHWGDGWNASSTIPSGLAAMPGYVSQSPLSSATTCDDLY